MSNDKFSLGGWTIALRENYIARDGALIRLKPKAMDVLECLAAAGGDVVTRQEIFDTVWPKLVVSDATLSQCIVELRHAFGETAKESRIIETIPKVGFRLRLPVIPLSATAEANAVVNRWFLSGKILFLLVILFLAGFWYWIDREKNVAPGDTLRVKSIAVLPFKNLGDSADQAYFVQGIQDVLTTELSKVESLGVVSRTSTQQYQDSDKSIPQIAQELGVDLLLEGSVLYSGERVRINAQLIEGETDRHIWAETYDREMGDILKLQSEITHEIVEHINISLSEGDVQRLTTHQSVNPEAFKLYLQAMSYIENWSPQDMLRGINLMREAVRLDPNSALLNAGLALSLQWTSWFDYILPLEVVDEARSAARRAVKLDPQLAEAHLALGAVSYYMDFNPKLARQELELALQFNPGYGKTLIELSWLEGEAGHIDNALELAQRVVKIDPHSAVAHGALGQANYLARRHEQSRRYYRQAKKLAPGDPSTYYFLAWPNEQLGEFERAIELHRAAVRLSGGDPIFLSGLGYALALSGRRDEARQVLDQLLSRAADGSVAPIYLAELYLGLGQREQAMNLLEKAFQIRNSHIMYLRQDPKFDPLRSNPRFQVLIRKIWSTD